MHCSSTKLYAHIRCSLYEQIAIDMPRKITFSINKKEFKSIPVKVDRRKLYGWTELKGTDDKGNACKLLTADESGKYILPIGGTGIGLLSQEGRWVERSELNTIDAKGEALPWFESSFDTVTTLSEQVTPEEFLDYSITHFYQLPDVPADILDTIGTAIYTFNYSYKAGYDPSPAFLMKTGETLFLLIGVKNKFDFLCVGNCESIHEDAEDLLIEDGEETIDFSMF